MTVISILLAAKLTSLEPILLATKNKDKDEGLRRFDLAEETRFECNAAGAAVTKLRLGPRIRQPSSLPPIWALPSWEFQNPIVLNLFAKLSSLEHLELIQCDSFRLFETLHHLPNLKVLVVSCFTSNGSSMFYDKEHAPHGLEQLYIGDDVLNNDDDLAYFFVEMLPRLPKLTIFKAGSENRMESFQRTAERIKEEIETANTTSTCTSTTDDGEDDDDDDDSSVVITTRLNNSNKYNNIKNNRYRLRTLICNPVPDVLDHDKRRRNKAKETQIKDKMDDPREIEAVKTILRTFPELSYIRGVYGWNLETGTTHEIHGNTDVQYLFEMNHAGRVLIESRAEYQEGITISSSGGLSTDTDSSSSTSASNSPPSKNESIPLSVWPLVLERAWKYGEQYLNPSPKRYFNPSQKPGRGATGVYYLLQNSLAPILLQEWSGTETAYDIGKCEPSTKY